MLEVASQHHDFTWSVSALCGHPNLDGPVVARESSLDVDRCSSMSSLLPILLSRMLPTDPLHYL